MSAQPVDVLAVLDSCKGQAHDVALTHSTSEPLVLHYNNVRAARAAVAELIEASQALVHCGTRPVSLEELDAAYVRTEAALARCGVTP